MFPWSSNPVFAHDSKTPVPHRAQGPGPSGLTLHSWAFHYELSPQLCLGAPPSEGVDNQALLKVSEDRLESFGGMSQSRAPPGRPPFSQLCRPRLRPRALPDRTPQPWLG